MKKFKKVFAVILSLAMVLGMSVTAFAANPGTDGKYGTGDDEGTITVSGITPEAGITVNAYQIVEANYNNKGSFSGYSPVYGNDSVTIDETTGNITVTDAQLKDILAQAKAANVTATPMQASEDGTSYSAQVPVGSYLVVITGAERKIYSNVVVSVMYQNDEGQNVLNEGDVNVVADGNAWVKVQDEPDFDKVIENSDLTLGTGENETANDKANTANLNGEVEYKITASIPYYGGDYPRFEITDTLTRLTYKANSLEVKATDKEGNETILSNNADAYYVATPTTIEKTFNLNFVTSAGYTLNDFAGGTLEITYTATLDAGAELNEVGNPNNARLDYTRDSKVDGNDGHKDEETKTYTFDIDGQVEGDVSQKIISKVEGEVTQTSSKEALEDAVFTLYTVNPDEVDNPDDYIYSNKVFTGTVTSNTKKDNNLPIKGLAKGTYYLKETHAPEGYSLNTHVFKIVIDANADDEGNLLNWTITIDDDKISTFTVDQGTKEATPQVDTTYIPNTKLASLPSTGGIGTTIFTIGGCAIMIIAAALFFASRKKSAK